jgi:hypothetical protein
MKEYHLHPDGRFIIRLGTRVVAILEAEEFFQFGVLELPPGCTEVFVNKDGLVLATINMAKEGLGYNPLQPFIDLEYVITSYYKKKSE